MQENRITDDIEVLLAVLPNAIENALRKIGRFSELVEIVMDLGRSPEARFASAKASNNGKYDGKDDEIILQAEEVTREDIKFVLDRIGQIDDDNRSGIARTLHRISVIKNRRGDVVGVTCRVGRAVYGTLEIIKDIILGGKSILLLGRPGVGKTTMLREAARVLADTRRVVIVDTSNEIGGDGDIAHPAVGRARRMQVATPSRQDEVMIEAVENHTPQVIVIDEIGREAEAEAARTIAERGVQLIGTAHGQTLDNLLANPTLSDLVGGIESVTLSDEEARRRKTQKTVLERRAPPTFNVLIEIQERAKLLVHHNVSEAVDSILRGRVPPAELRFFDAEGKLCVEKPIKSTLAGNIVKPPNSNGNHEATDVHEATSKYHANGSHRQSSDGEMHIGEDIFQGHLSKLNERMLQIFAFGIPKNRMQQAIRSLGLPADLVDSVDDADVLITSKSYYRQRSRAITDAEHRNIPIYVLRSNSETQMENILAGLFNLSDSSTTPLDDAMTETETAIHRVMSGERSVDLMPQNQFVRRRQHELVRKANLISHSYGKEPYRRVRLFRD